MFLAIATSMIAIRATVTTNVDWPMKIGQKCFCAVHDKHLFHISFNEALLIGAANSSVSENNPEAIDSVRKPFLRISKNFRKQNKEIKKTKNKKKKDLATSLPTTIFGQIFVFFVFLFCLVFLVFVFWFLFFGFACFFCFFFWFFGFAGCLGFNPLYCVGSLC